MAREIIEASRTRLARYTPASVAPAVLPIFGASSVMIPNPPPGTIAVPLFESPADDLQGMYVLYIKVERMP